MEHALRRIGLDRTTAQPAVIAAYERGEAICQSTYAGDRCCVHLEDAGTDWRIRVIRVSDSNETTELIPKD